MRAFQQTLVPAALTALALAVPAQAKSDTERVLVNNTAGTITLHPSVLAIPDQALGVTVFAPGSSTGMLFELDPRTGVFPDIHLRTGERASFTMVQASLSSYFLVNFDVLTDPGKPTSINNGTLIYGFHPGKMEAPKVKLEVLFREGGGLVEDPNVLATPTRSDAAGTVIELTSVKPRQCCTIL